MEPKQRKSRRKLPTEIPPPEQAAEMLRLAAMLERLAAEIRRLVGRPHP